MRFAIVAILALVAAPVAAEELTVNQPHRADTYSGVFFGFAPNESYAGFSTTHDDIHVPPVPDRIFSADNDTEWSIWDIALCDGGYCGTIRHVCTMSAITVDSVTLDCLDIEC